MLNRGYSAGQLEDNDCKTGLYINGFGDAKEAPGDARHCLEIYHLQKIWCLIYLPWKNLYLFHGTI